MYPFVKLPILHTQLAHMSRTEMVMVDRTLIGPTVLCYCVSIITSGHLSTNTSSSGPALQVSYNNYVYQILFFINYFKVLYYFRYSSTCLIISIKLIMFLKPQLFGLDLTFFHFIFILNNKRKIYVMFCFF